MRAAHGFWSGFDCDCWNCYGAGDIAPEWTTEELLKYSKTTYLVMCDVCEGTGRDPIPLTELR